MSCENQAQPSHQTEQNQMQNKAIDLTIELYYMARHCFHTIHYLSFNNSVFAYTRTRFEITSDKVHYAGLSSKAIQLFNLQ